MGDEGCECDNQKIPDGRRRSFYIHIFPEWSRVAEQLAEMSRNGITFEDKEGDVYFSNVTNQFNITQSRIFDISAIKRSVPGTPVNGSIEFGTDCIY